MPLYTIWTTGTTRDQLIAVLHCTAGDVLIALSAWACAIVIAVHPEAGESPLNVALLTIAFGLLYSGYSEWLNTTVRQSWTYSDGMPVVPVLGLGLSPLLRWLAIPVLALWAADPRSDGAAPARHKN